MTKKDLMQICSGDFAKPESEATLPAPIGSATCAWWIDDGDDEEAWHITCDRPATHHVSKPGRVKMPLCADHVKIYQSSPEKYTVEELPNAAGEQQPPPTNQK